MLKRLFAAVFLTAAALPALPTLPAYAFQAQSIVSDSAGVRIVQSTPADNPAVCRVSKEPILSIGSDDDDLAYLFYRANHSAELSDGRIAILDGSTNEVRMFDPSGTFLYSFGEEGDGPGEFNRPTGIWRLDGDSLLIGTGEPFRFDFFTNRGDYIRSISLEGMTGRPSGDAISGDGTSVVGHRGSDAQTIDFSQAFAEYRVHDSGGAFVQSLGNYPTYSLGMLELGDMRFIIPPLFEAVTAIDGMRDRFAIGSAGRPEIKVYSFKDPTSPLQIIRWESMRERTVLPADIRDYRNAARRRHLSRTDITPADEAAVEADTHEDRPTAEHFPAFQTVRMGTDQRVWVGRYQRPLDDSSLRWFVFEPDGQFLCHVSTEPGFWAHHFGSDYILGKLTVDGVETIRKYALQALE